jgi:hypothetical protein
MNNFGEFTFVNRHRSLGDFYVSYLRSLIARVRQDHCTCQILSRKRRIL